MGRPRSQKWAWLPDKVYFKKGRYIILINGKETYLCPGDASRAEVYQAADRFINDDNEFTLAWLVQQYLKSDKFKRLAPASQESYERLLIQLIEWVMPRTGEPFGTLYLDEVGNTTIQSAYDQQEGHSSKNRRFTVLKAVYNWGRQRYPIITTNPVVGLETLPEAPRSRYITHAEYNYIYEKASPMVRLMMEGAYLLRARRGELSNLLRIDSIRERGVLIERSKGSWDGVVTWSPRLRQWVKDCKAHNSGVVSKWLIHNGRGGKVTKSAFDSAWTRAWKNTDGSIERFPFHDIKAKGITDHPKKEGGHKSEKMREVYDRENRLEEPTK